MINKKIKYNKMTKLNNLDKKKKLVIFIKIKLHQKANRI